MTRYLLDTHALIWWLVEDPALSSSARSVIIGDDPIAVSSISIYEIANKARSGRWPALSHIVNDIDRTLMTENFGQLSLSDRHALRAGSMPGKHRDPFDRMIAAQALIEGMTVITRDSEIAGFGCATLW